jgi:hypothetical protein
MLAATQQKVAKRIEKLLREKRMNDNQLLHLLYIFSREEKVKITRSHHCRLLRVERYGEETLKNVIQFLDVVESLDSTDLIPKKETQQRSSIDMSKRKSRISHHIPDSSAQRVVRPKIARKAPESLPRVEMPGMSSQPVRTMAGEDSASNVTALNEWMTQQIKRAKQARKMDPSICCPGSMSTLPVSDRQIPLKKKRKKTARKRALEKIKEDEEIELIISTREYADDQENEIDEIEDLEEVLIFGEEDDEEDPAGEDENIDLADDEDENEEEVEEDHSNDISVAESDDDDEMDEE